MLIYKDAADSHIKMYDPEVIASALIAYGLDNLANMAGTEEAANRCALLWQAFDNLSPDRGKPQ